jgi:hypothetical protein
MDDTDKHHLLFGPYTAPPLRKGERAHCLLRDALVVVTSWTDAPISWPRCRALGHRGGSGLLLDEELARAVRCESSLAILHHWGVTGGAVTRWRKALGVWQAGTEDTQRLYRASSEAGAGRWRGKKLPPEVIERRRGQRR